MQGEQLARRGLADGQTRDADQHREQALDLTEGPSEGPAEKNSAAPPRTPMLEPVFENDRRCRPWQEPRSSDAFSGSSDGGHRTNRYLRRSTGRGWLVLLSQFAALLLVVGASSGGLMASSPDRPGKCERRIDRRAPDQAGQQPAQLGDGERDQHAQGGHHDRPPSPSAASGRRARVAARNARAAMARVMCRYQARYWRTW